MFAKAAAEASTPEEAIKEAEEKCVRIYAKWKEKNLI